ncbi:MAG: hypothetical protein JW990_16935 [Thermoleophilia bacterium]|nr:hypothetical protein [Thermoleophilia bacterium]
MGDDISTALVSPDRVELEWAYQPVDFFEFAYEYRYPDFEVSVEDGRAIATLTTPHEPVAPALQQRIVDCMTGIFLARQLQTHREFDLGLPTVHVHFGSRTISSKGFAIDGIIAEAIPPDVVTTDADGNVHDTRAERIARHAATLDLLATKLSRGSVLRRMLESYSHAVEDPDDEWIYLYEIRDALATHYKSHRKARAALGIAQGEWDRVGVLANVEPILQGRHRGHHGNLRPATQEELAEVRQTVRRWIETFAQQVSEDREP